MNLKNLTVYVNEKEVVRDFSLVICPGEIHALMGPNGSGKSSLAYAIAGHPEYRIASGSVMLKGVDLLALPPEKRARAGLFLSFQEPPEVGGVSMSTFLHMIGADKGDHADRPVGGEESKDIPVPPLKIRATRGRSFQDDVQPEKDMKDMAAELGLHDSFLLRFLNEGFSGGEKKKSELLQLIARKPKIAICDEIDSGLDLDALKSVAKILRGEATRGAGLLLISHSPRLFDLMKPDFVHVLLKGKLVASGGSEILKKLERSGYRAFEKN